MSMEQIKNNEKLELCKKCGEEPAFMNGLCQYCYEEQLEESKRRPENDKKLKNKMVTHSYALKNTKLRKEREMGKLKKIRKQSINIKIKK